MVSGSVVLQLVKSLHTSKTACETLRFSKDAVRGVSITDHVAVTGVTVRTKTGYTLFAPSRGATRCYRVRLGSCRGDLIKSRSTICVGAVACGTRSFIPIVTYPSRISGVESIDRLRKARVSRMFVKSYAGNHLRSLETTTRMLGKGGTTSFIGLVIAPTDHGVCERTLTSKALSVLTRTNTVVARPNYKLYYKEAKKVLSSKRHIMTAGGEGFLKHVKASGMRVCLTDPEATTTYTITKGVMGPRWRKGVGDC